MLLELHDLDRSLRHAGIAPGVTDQRIQPYPKRKALEVRLGPDGRITGLRFLDPSQVQAFWKFECSKGGLRESTPGFNIDPLWRTRDGQGPSDSWLEAWRKSWKSAATSLAKRTELLTERKARCEANWDLSESSKINACLRKAAVTLRGELSGTNDPKILAVLELLRRSETFDARRLHAALDDELRAAATSGSAGLTPDDCRSILYSDREPGHSKPASKEGVSLVLELDDATDFGGYPVNHQAVWKALNQHLIAKQIPSPPAPATHGGPVNSCGIFGEPLPTKIGSMPERTLPRVGKVKLFSLSAQTPCQSRYGLIESSACPVGPELQDRLSAALEWICRADMEGKTWDDVSNACGYERKALLLAYPGKLIDDAPGLSGLMVRRRPDSQARAEAEFTTRTEQVVKALEGAIADDPTLGITVVVIVKADTARKRLLYSRQFTANRLIEAAREWQTAARNTPPIFIRAFRDDKPVWQRPRIPYPNELVRIINTCWESNGERSKKVSNIRIGAALTLLLETGPLLDQAVREALRCLVRNVTPLVLALARAHAEGRVAKAAATSDLPLLVPSILGLLLEKAGQSKGAYMSENAYLIGRLMSIADEFHRNYCKKERKGKEPPQLLGNALMTTALENPVAGLARLAERLSLYQRVADEKLRNRAGEVEQAIKKSELPIRCSDEEKAQMLLGYLARPLPEGQDVVEPVAEPEDHEETHS